MSTYPFDDLQGAGTGSQDLTAGTQYTFNLTNNSGSSYFTMETPRNFDGVTPRNLSGSIVSASSGVVFNQSDYIAGFALPTGNNSFVFTPSTNVTGSTLKLRGTGGIYVELSGSGGSVIDTDAQAFLAAAVITDPTITSAIDTLVVDLKGYGIWTKMKAIYPFVGGTATTHKYNLKDPRDLDAAFRLVFNGGITHDANGITGNGTNGYADTKIVLNTLSRDSNSAGVYIRTNSNTGTDFGLYDSGTQGSFNFTSREAGDLSYIRNGSTNFDTVANTDSRGFYQITRRDSSQIIYSKNTTKTTISRTATDLFVNANTIPLMVLRAGVSLTVYSARNYSLHYFGNTSLTDTELDNMNTAVQAFNTTLSRNV